jgi:diadenosine tetraphosphate (Ap4A) HIT family hydrolase
MVQLVLLILLGCAALLADTSGCDCDPSRPETMKRRECSLCAEAEKRPADIEFFLLKDVNPRKPNRWLALPRAHAAGAHHLHEMPQDQQTRFWRFAIAEAKKLFGDEWALAYNGWRVRTQCHGHIHVGRLIKAAKIARFKFVKRVEDFPAPNDSGVWIYAVPGGFRVHTGEQITETALVR